MKLTSTHDSIYTTHPEIVAFNTLFLLVVCDTFSQFLIQVRLLREDYTFPVDWLLVCKTQSIRGEESKRNEDGDYLQNRYVNFAQEFTTGKREFN